MMESVSSLQRIEVDLLNDKLEKEIDNVETQVQSYKKQLFGFECQDDEIRTFGSWISSRFGVREAAMENLTQEFDDANHSESGRGFQKKVVDSDDSEERVLVDIQSGSVRSSSSFEFCNPMNCSSRYNEKLAEIIDREVSQLGFSDDAYYREGGNGFHKKVVGGDDSEERVSVGIQSVSVSSSSSSEFCNPMNCSSKYNDKLAENIERKGSRLGFLEYEGGDDSQKSKVTVHLGDIKQLHMRLQILEEDYQLMKVEFAKSVEERCELLTEITSQFHLIQQPLRNRVAVKRPLEGYSVISSSKDGSIGIGLSQVLHQAPSSSFVTRVLKASNFTFQNCTGEMQVLLRASLLSTEKVKTF